MKRIELTHIDLVSEVNKRRTAMAARDETITKKSGEGKETIPIVGVEQESTSKRNLMVPPAPPPSPADATDMSKYKLSYLKMGCTQRPARELIWGLWPRLRRLS
ncbi:hypothetical protein ACRRTK_004656 [Alexandromys fortis]